MDKEDLIAFSETISNVMTRLVIDEDVCNGLKRALVFRGLNCLKSILVKRNSLRNLKSFCIYDCAMLEKITIENGYSQKGSFHNAKIVELSSLFGLV